MKILLVTNKLKTYPLMYQIIIDTIHELGHEIIWAADFTQFIGDTNVIPCEIRNICIHSNFILSNKKKNFFKGEYEKEIEDQSLDNKGVEKKLKIIARYLILLKRMK